MLYTRVKPATGNNDVMKAKENRSVEHRTTPKRAD